MKENAAEDLKLKLSLIEVKKNMWRFYRDDGKMKKPGDEALEERKKMNQKKNEKKELVEGWKMMKEMLDFLEEFDDDYANEKVDDAKVIKNLKRKREMNENDCVPFSKLQKMNENDCETSSTEQHLRAERYELNQCQLLAVGENLCDEINEWGVGTS